MKNNETKKETTMKTNLERMFNVAERVFLAIGMVSFAGAVACFVEAVATR